MFNFFKRKKDGKRKRGGQKGREVGVAAHEFATPRGETEGSVENRTSIGVDQREVQSPTMGNDISKPISALQGLGDIPFIEIDNAHDCVVASRPFDQTVSAKCLPSENNGNVSQYDPPVSSEPDKVSLLQTGSSIDQSSELESPSLVKRISELQCPTSLDTVEKTENIENAVSNDFKISAESESDWEKYVICDDAAGANGAGDEKSVTGTGPDLASPGPVANSAGYSLDSGDTVSAPTSDGEMNRVGQYAQDSGAQVLDKLKCNSETSLYAPKSDREPLANDVDTDDTSDDELSESDQSESDNVVKNDSGCWDERENSLFLCGSENHINRHSSLCSVSDVGDGKCKGNKHVRWADIDGKRKLTHEREGSVISSEESSSEEESDDEEPEKEEDDDEEEDSEGEGDDEVQVESNEENSSLTKVKLIEKCAKDIRAEPDPISSEEENSEDEKRECDKEVTGINNEEALKTEEKCEKEPNDELSESEEESSAEESGNENESKEEENKPMRIDIAEMQNRITDLQRDVNLKTSNIDRLQVELDAACNESEMVRKRFKRLEADLDLYKQTNRDLTDRINTSASQEVEKAERNNKQLEEADRKIKALEDELAKVKSELIYLQASYKKLEADRDMEVQIIQKALEKALTDQEEMEAKYEKEFENLRTLNSSREVQMLEDFEWKLREVQKTSKKKMQESEKESERKHSELANKLAAAQCDLDQISHLKLCEIELNQLKQTSSEQRKNLRLTNRKLEELQVSEKILQEEVHSLRASLDKEKNHVSNLQTIHREELIEKDKKAKLKLELQISQLQTEWEQRLRKENIKIKTETEKMLREEKNVAVDLAKKLKEQEISQLKQNWEMKSQEFKKEIENYKKKVCQMEDNHRLDYDKVQTNADRDLFDLRRKMDKLDMSYQEKIEKIQEQHEKELNVLKEECDRRVQQSEASLQLQVGNSRTTIELVKQQLQNEAQLKIEQLENEYQKKLDQQWERLNKEKEQVSEKLEQSHKQSLEILCLEIEKLKKQSKTVVENQGKKNHPANQSPRTAVSAHKRNSSNSEVGHHQNAISTRLDVAEVAEEIRAQGKEDVLQKCIEQLTKQLNAGKMEIEKLRQQLEVRDNAKQQNQKNVPQVAPTPRRNRKPRSGRN